MGGDISPTESLSIQLLSYNIMFLLEMMDKKNYNYMEEHSIQLFLLVKVTEVGSKAVN